MNAISGLPKKNSAEKLAMPKTTMIRTRMNRMLPTIFDIRYFSLVLNHQDWGKRLSCFVAVVASR
jgi:L-lactate utilization protein LutB